MIEHNENNNIKSKNVERQIKHSLPTEKEGHETIDQTKESPLYKKIYMDLFNTVLSCLESKIDKEKIEKIIIEIVNTFQSIFQAIALNMELLRILLISRSY